MPKSDTSEILLVDQPGIDKLCRMRTLLDAFSKVKFTCYGVVSVRKNYSNWARFFPAITTKFGINVREGAIAKNSFVHEFQIYTGKHGGAERVLEWYKIWQTNRKENFTCAYFYFILFFFFYLFIYFFLFI